MKFLHRLFIYPLTLITSVVRTVFSNDAKVIQDRPAAVTDSDQFDDLILELIADLSSPFDQSHRVLLLRFYQRLMDKEMIRQPNLPEMYDKDVRSDVVPREGVTRVGHQNSFFAAVRQAGAAEFINDSQVPYISLRKAAVIHADLKAR